MDKAFLEQMKRKVEAELCGREIEAVSFWKTELEKILRQKTESLSSLQVELRNLIVRMENRLKTVKRRSDM